MLENVGEVLKWYLPELRPTVVRTLLYRGCIQVNLAHQGMGDVMGSILADCLAGLPLMRELSLRDNRLTDKGLIPIVKVIRLVYWKTHIATMLPQYLAVRHARSCVACYRTR